MDVAFAEVFDHALRFHGFADHGRDYDLFIEVIRAWRPEACTGPVRYRFRHCVEAEVVTALRPSTWQASLDDAALDSLVGDGYGWSVRWQNLYPGIALVDGSERAARWSDEVGIPFHEVRIETNVHLIHLVTTGLEVDAVDVGTVPFRVGGP